MKSKLLVYVKNESQENYQFYSLLLENKSLLFVNNVILYDSLNINQNNNDLLFQSNPNTEIQITLKIDYSDEESQNNGNFYVYQNPNGNVRMEVYEQFIQFQYIKNFIINSLLAEESKKKIINE